MDEVAEMKKPPKGLKIPKNMGAVADMYYNFREERLAIQGQAKGVAEKESYVREYLINKLPKSDASGVAGKVARVRVYTEEILIMNDFDKFLQWVIKEKAYDCLGRTFSSEAVKARIEAGTKGKKVPKIPGIGTFNVVKLGYNKL